MSEPHAVMTGSRGGGRWAAAIAGLLFVFVALALAAPARAAVPQFTPVSASVLAPPEPITGTDGRRHLAHEILLQNTAGARLEVQSLAVRARDGGTLLTVAATEIPGVMTDVSQQPTSSLAPGEGGRVWLDLSLPRESRVPRALVHQFVVVASLPTGESRTLTFDAARTRVDRRQMPSLSPPLHGGPYLNFNGCCGLSPHRLALVQVDGSDYLSERFASDFIRIDEQGRGAEGDPTRSESFFTFGEPVYAWPTVASCARSTMCQRTCRSTSRRATSSPRARSWATTSCSSSATDGSRPTGI